MIIISGMIGVDGLKEANIIVIKGYKVGQINEIVFNPEDISHIVVHVSLNAGVRIPKNSIAKIYSIDFLGNKGIDLILSGSKEFCKEKDTLTGEFEIPISEQIMPIKKSFETILFTLDTLSKNAMRIFDHTTNDHIKESFSNIQLITASIVSQKQKLGMILDELESITGAFSENNKYISATFKNIYSITDTVEHSQIRSAIFNLNTELRNQRTHCPHKMGHGTHKIDLHDTLYIQLSTNDTTYGSVVTLTSGTITKKYTHYTIYRKRTNTSKGSTGQRSKQQTQADTYDTYT